MREIICKLEKIQSDYVDVFRMNCSKEDMKSNSDAKKLARYINRHGRKTDKLIKIINKIM